MDFDERCPFSSGAKAEKFISNTPWYSLSVVEILERSAVAAWNTVDKHFHKNSDIEHSCDASKIRKNRWKLLKFCMHRYNTLIVMDEKTKSQKSKRK